MSIHNIQSYEKTRAIIRKQVRNERVFWVGTVLSAVSFAVLAGLTGCGGGSQDQDTETNQELVTEAQTRCHELNPAFTGPCGITDPAAYLAANGPATGHP